MVVYFILAVANLIFVILFAIDKFFVKDYIDNPCEKAKSLYKKAGIIETSLFGLGFMFMGFYDLSVNLGHTALVLEGFGLFILLFAILAFIFFSLMYHTVMIDYHKSVEENEEIKKEIDDYIQ